jgi:hypothetical protein
LIEEMMGYVGGYSGTIRALSEEKGKEEELSKRGKILKKTYEWLKWNVAETASFPFHRPCLEQ